MKVSRSSLGFASLSLLALAGCPVTADALCDKGVCDALTTTPDATSPVTDAGEDAIVSLPRDPCVDKPLATECVTNEGALFVSGAADPATADGSIAHPYKTISAAVNKVTNDKRRIYVCEGTYAEQVSLETIPKTLIGGIACDFKSPAAKAKIAPASGIALSIAAVGGASVIDIEVEGTSSVNEKGASSVAIFVTRAKDILIRGVDAKATDAQPGLDGTGKVNWDASEDQPFGNNASGAAGGGPPACKKCKDMTSTFAGGGGNTTGGLPEAGAAQPPVGGSNNGANAMPCLHGDAGAPGDPAASAAGSDRPGVVKPSAWDTTATSTAGGSGRPGQGGGGGGSNGTMGGGSGGCGGCGGGGGAAGGNGGSSIALLVYASEVSVERSVLIAGNAGGGGKGGNGQIGQDSRTGAGGVCNGGPGGAGAGGGGGGGGAGGYSAAIAHAGAAPKVVETMLTKGTAGGAGAGGDPGPPALTSGGKAGNAGLAGVAGQAGETLDIK